MNLSSEDTLETRSKPMYPRGRAVYTALMILLAMITVVLATWHWIAPRWSPINYALTREALPAVPQERRPSTLPAELFSGRAAEGYRIAHERPELLERLPCYCGCYLSSGHANNLDCFRDRHSETCDVSVSIAMEGEKLARQGYSAEDIKAIIDRKFASRFNGSH
ncbi:MAG: CYCXC family (seleno)protein [Candidatus Acidiferrales bacterium]